MNRHLLASLIALLLTGCRAAPPTEDYVILNHLRAVRPDQIRFRYELPRPVKWAEIVFKDLKNNAISLEIDFVFGNGKKITLPNSILKCFPYPRPSESFFRVLLPAENYPASKGDWSASLMLPFGINPDMPQEDGVSRPDGGFPLVELHINDWEFSYAKVYNGNGGKPRELVAPFRNCPPNIERAS